MSQQPSNYQTHLQQQFLPQLQQQSPYLEQQRLRLLQQQQLQFQQEQQMQVITPGPMNPLMTQPFGNPIGSSAPVGHSDAAYIWQGILEWQDRSKSSGAIIEQVLCMVTVNCKINDFDLKAEHWPPKLSMQLLPKQLISNIGNAYLRNSTSVVFNISPSESSESLTQLMSAGYAGCVQFINTPAQVCDLKVIILLYTPDKKVFLGFIPKDQSGFVDRLRLMIQARKQFSTQQCQIQDQNMASSQTGMPPGHMQGQPVSFGNGMMPPSNITSQMNSQLNHMDGVMPGDMASSQVAMMSNPYQPTMTYLGSNTVNTQQQTQDPNITSSQTGMYSRHMQGQSVSFGDGMMPPGYSMNQNSQPNHTSTFTSQQNVPTNHQTHLQQQFQPQLQQQSQYMEQQRLRLQQQQQLEFQQEQQMQVVAPGPMNPQRTTQSLSNPNVSSAPVGHSNAGPIWHGILEWQDRSKPSGAIIKQVLCMVTVNCQINDFDLKAEQWPPKLTMQLLPKQLISNVGNAYLKNSTSVLFNISPSESTNSLTNFMSTGYAGCVQFNNTPGQVCDLKILILLYTSEKKAYLGFIPKDQNGFIDRLRSLVQARVRLSAQQRQTRIQNTTSSQIGVPPVSTTSQMNSQPNHMAGPVTIEGQAVPEPRAVEQASSITNPQQVANFSNDEGRILEDLEAQILCIICLTRRRTHAPFSCRHLSVCEACVFNLMCSENPTLMRCPVCREELTGLEDWMQIYF